MNTVLNILKKPWFGPASKTPQIIDTGLLFNAIKELLWFLELYDDGGVVMFKKKSPCLSETCPVIFLGDSKMIPYLEFASKNQGRDTE